MIGNCLKLAIVATFAVVTGAQAAELPNAATAFPVQPVQVASLGGPSEAAPRTGDGLHADPRWPNFANCINNTGSRAQFEACLRSAFMKDSTGTEASLLSR